MRYFFLYFNLFGMWTVWENSKRKFFFQTNFILCSIIVLLSFVHAIFFNQFFERNSLLGSINNLLFIFIFASHLTIIVETMYSTSIQLQIIEMFSFVDRYFAMKFGISTQYKCQKRNLFALSVVLMLPVILTNIMILSYIYFWKAVFSNGLLSMYSTWITRSRLIQVIFLVYLLRERLKTLNYELKHSVKQSILFERVLHLKEAYGQLSDLCALINKAFGWSLLTLVVQCFVDITINCYATFLYFAQASYEDLIGLIILIGMAGAYLILLATLTFYSSSCSEYVRNPSTHYLYQYMCNAHCAW